MDCLEELCALFGIYICTFRGWEWFLFLANRQKFLSSQYDLRTEFLGLVCFCHVPNTLDWFFIFK